MQRLAVKLAQFLLKRNLSKELKAKLMTSILDNLRALPFRDIISVNEQGVLLVNNRSLELEQAIQLRESARSALQSVALKFVNDQVSFKAVNIGIHNLETVDQILFSRAAIWWGQQQQNLLHLLAKEDGTSPILEDYK